MTTKIIYIISHDRIRRRLFGRPIGHTPGRRTRNQCNNDVVHSSGTGQTTGNPEESTRGNSREIEQGRTSSLRRRRGDDVLESSGFGDTEIVSTCSSD